MYLVKRNIEITNIKNVQLGTEWNAIIIYCNCNSNNILIKSAQN